VPLVSNPAAFACRAEGLTGARAGPDRPIVGPAGEPQGVGPDPDSGEERALNKSGELAGLDILDRPFINDSVRDQASGDQLA
jgi:hypothetical protein